MNNNQLNFAASITPHSRNMLKRIEEIGSIKKTLAKAFSNASYRFAIADKDIVCGDIKPTSSIFFVISVIPNSIQIAELAREDMRIRMMISEACETNGHRCVVAGTQDKACDLLKLPRTVKL